MAGLAIGREAISLRLLACGALFILTFWPESAIGPGFQLSFAAVTAIVSLYEHPRIRAVLQARDEPVWSKSARFLCGLFITGLAVEVVLAPIVLYHFHRAGLMGSLANMVAIPLTEFVVMPAEALALFLDLANAGAPAWWVVEHALAIIIAMAHFITRQNGALMLSPAIPPWAFALSMAGLFWMMLWRTRMRWAGLLLLLPGVAGYALAPVPDLLVTGDGHHVALRMAGGDIALLRAGAGEYVRDQFTEQAASDGMIRALADLPAVRCSPELCVLDFPVDGPGAISGSVDPERGHAGYPHPAGAISVGIKRSSAGQTSIQPANASALPHSVKRGRRILMTRSRLPVPWRDLMLSCAAADIVIADRRLPRACRPRWLKLDRANLAREGGAAIMLSAGHVRRSRDPNDQHPWSRRR